MVTRVGSLVFLVRVAGRWSKAWIRNTIGGRAAFWIERGSFACFVFAISSHHEYQLVSQRPFPKRLTDLVLILSVAVVCVDEVRSPLI